MNYLRVLEGVLQLPPEVVDADGSELPEQASEVVVSPPLVLVLASVSRRLLANAARAIRATVLPTQQYRARAYTGHSFTVHA